MKNEHESEYDTEMSGDDGHTNNSLVSRNRIDDTMRSLLDNFEVLVPVLLQWHVMNACLNLLITHFISCTGRW